MLTFNSTSSRLLGTDYVEYNIVLKKFLTVINTTEIISEYVISCCELYKYNIPQDIAMLKGYSRNEIPYLGDTTEMEVAHIYQLLTYIVNNDIFVPDIAKMKYSRSNKYNDIIADFNSRVVSILMKHITDYLKGIGIQMGIDEQVIYNVSITNEEGLVNVALGNSEINSLQNISINVTNITSLIENVRKNIPDKISMEDKDTINDDLDIIKEELQSESPKQKVLKRSIRGLDKMKNSIPEAIEFVAAITTLAQCLQPLLVG